MRLAFLAAADSIHTQRWVNEMDRRGHEVHLFSAQASIPGFRPGVRRVRLPFPGALGYFASAAWARRRLGALRPDLVHAHYASGYGTLARLCGVRPCILSVWGSDVTDFPVGSRMRRALLAANLRWPDQVAATSLALREETLAIQAPSREIRITPFGVDCEAFAPRPRAPGAALRMGTVKSLAPQYGIDVLLRAFRRVVMECGEPVKLVIVGGGPQEGELRRMAGSLGVSPLVEFTGPVAHEEVPDRLAELDVFLALSRSESFGVAAIEASACGLPVVVSDAGGLPEVVRDGVTGFVVPREDHEAAAERALRLLRDRNLRQSMGAAGRNLVIADFEWGRCADRMEDLYRDVRSQAAGGHTTPGEPATRSHR